MRNTAVVAFLALGVIWGSSFIFMKWAAETISPEQITLLRVTDLDGITAIAPDTRALAIGWLLVGEPLDWLDGAAVLLVLAGVVVLRLRAAAR